MQKTIQLTEADLEKLREAKAKKQKYTKGGNPLGKTPQQHYEEAMLLIYKKHGLPSGMVVFADLEAGTIRYEEPDSVITLPSTGNDAVDDYRTKRDVPVHVVSSQSHRDEETGDIKDGLGNTILPAENKLITALIPLSEEEKAQLKVFDDMYDRSLAILQICNDQVVEDETTRAIGFSVAKQTDEIIKELDSRRLQLNKKPKKEIDDRNALVKKLTTPLEAGLATLKKRLTDYQVSVEEKRKQEQAALAKQQEEQRLKDEAEKARIQKINTSIQDFRQKSDTEISAIESTEQLEAFIKKINGWIPKLEYYQEFHPQVLEEKKAAIARAEGRRSVVKELENAKAEAEAASQKSAAEKAQADAKLKQMQQQQEQAAERERQAKAKQQEQAKQHEATCRLTISSKLQLMGWPASELEDQLKYVADIYGDFTTAVNKIMDFSSRLTIRFQEYQEAINLQAQKQKNLRTTWKYRVTDLNLVPREYLQLDEKKLTNYLSSKKEAIKAGAPEVQIPGIEFYSQTDATLGS